MNFIAYEILLNIGIYFVCLARAGFDSYNLHKFVHQKEN